MPLSVIPSASDNKNNFDWLKIHPLEGWISDLQSSGSKAWKMAEMAMTDLGTNALPKIINDSIDDSMETQTRHLNAAMTLKFMGPGVRSSLPKFDAMLKIWKTGKSLLWSTGIAYSAPMAPEAFSTLTNELNNPNAGVRDAAIYGIGFCLQLEPNHFAEAALPLLMHNLKDPLD